MNLESSNAGVVLMGDVLMIQEGSVVKATENYWGTTKQSLI